MLAYWKCGEKIALFFCGLNLEQVLAYWKCGEKNRTFFGGLNLEEVLAYWNCGEKIVFFFWRSEPGTGAGLLKMWRKKIALFWRYELGTGASLLTENVERGSHFFFCGLNLEQMLAYWKCGEGIALFLRSENGTGASLQKMWRGDRTCFCVLNLEQVLAELTEIVEREIGTADFSQSMGMRVSLALFFALFHIFFTSFSPSSHYFLFFSSFFTFLFSHSFSHFRWPGRGRSFAAFPCLPLTYLTLLLLSSPSLTLIKKKKEHRDFQQISVLRSSCPPRRLIISRSIHMSSCRRWIQIVIPNVSCLWCVCGQSTLLNRSSFFGTGVEVQSWCQKPSLSCACTRERLSDVGSFFRFFW